MIAVLEPTLTVGDLRELQRAAAAIHAADALFDYIQALVEHTRSSGLFASGLSPRAALALLAAARAWALIAGRDAVLPEDVQAVLPSVAGHRLKPAGESGSATRLVRSLIEAVALP